MQHCCMIAAAVHSTNFRQTMIGQLFRQAHGNLTWPGHRTATPLRNHVPHFDLVVLGNVGLDKPGGAVPGIPRNGLPDELPEDQLCEDLPVAKYLRVVDDSLLVRSLVQADDVSRVWKRERAIREYLAAEPRLLPDNAM